MNCEYCQSPVHIWFQCPKKPDGWKPARLAKRSTALGKGRVIVGPVSASKPYLRNVPEVVDAQPGKRNASEGPAGTQALPVDTNSLQTQKASSGNADGGKPLTQTKPANSAGSTPAPATKFDKKTWQRNYMSSYMAQYRADVKAGKRVPKKREC